MTILLIAGSRHIVSDAMRDYTRRCVLRALDNGWSLIAGDALGVDKVVAQMVYEYSKTASGDCDDLITVYGIQDIARHGIFPRCSHYYNVLGHAANGVTVTNYATRDRFMVQVADKVMCIWNGTSRGTQAVFNYAQEIHKESWLMEFAA